MRIRIQIVFFLILLFSFCQGQKSSDKDFINRLESAENTKDLKEIALIYSKNATLYTTDLMPIQNVEAITDLYKFVFARNDTKNVTYEVDSAYQEKGQICELGILTTEKTDRSRSTQPFKVIFEKDRNQHKIVEISFGLESDLLKELPDLLEATGSYKVGLKTFFYGKANSGNGRLLSFQIWYPTLSDSDQRLPFRSEEVVRNVADFLGIPPFAISYFSKIESHSIQDAPVVREKQFPVLIYNHGYGGFTQVYQTVFEDLVSHGYIVVSIGHEDESAMLIKSDGDVVSNTPQNEFYANRSPELSGREIGQWQSIILNSDDYEDNDKAYQEMLKLTPLHNESVRLWESDTKATLKKLEIINGKDENLAGIFDLETMGIFGHSLGGATAGQLCAEKSPFKAGINLDGFQFGDLYDSELRVPFMFVSSNPGSDQYLRALSYLAESSEDCYQVAIKGFSHDHFTDLKYITEGDTMAVELQRALIRSFFDENLKDKTLNWNKLIVKYDQIRLTASKCYEVG